MGSVAVDLASFSKEEMDAAREVASTTDEEWREVSKFLAEGSVLFDQQGNSEQAKKLKLGSIAAAYMSFKNMRGVRK